MRLYLVRHGIAEDFADSDFARQLTARGRRRVKTAAAVMKRLNLRPARVYSSPRARARQTAEIIADALDLPVIIAEQVNFGFELSDINRLTRDLRVDDEVMFVGHNPDMSLLTHQLTGVDVSMKKGGLARIDVPGKQARDGELVWLIAPRVFDALGKSRMPSPVRSVSLSTPPQKLPQSQHALHRLIRHRWSPVGFDRERNIKRATLLSILEAARWAPSSSNIQPWRFIVGPRDNQAEFQKILSVLAEGNQAWARHAALLMIAVTHVEPKPGRTYRHAGHDLGQAIAQMALQALDYGIYTHQMAGFSPEKARELYQVPDDFEPFTAIALGYRTSDLRHLGDRQRARESSQRERRPLSEMIFSAAWGETADFTE